VERGAFSRHAVVFTGDGKTQLTESCLTGSSYGNVPSNCVFLPDGRNLLRSFSNRRAQRADQSGDTPAAGEKGRRLICKSSRTFSERLRRRTQLRSTVSIATLVRPGDAASPIVSPYTASCDVGCRSANETNARGLNGGVGPSGCTACSIPIPHSVLSAVPLTGIPSLGLSRSRPVSLACMHSHICKCVPRGQGKTNVGV